ncbi:hypothetical protein DHEL01_v202929 [Diaporthe helianthi]|uniref:Malate dehydrogenase n=1 Tax=Diaporthe helianthi TaxID=158607 RepID=A0A2P5I852_DIAHE|nr:hypothetical protein DHEL01_v202929 [Diaporthe helianthi]
MLFPKSVIVITSLATAAVAAPYQKRCRRDPAVAITLPSTGSTDLPAPDANLTLRYVAIGHGIQNYTCATANASAVATGALAVLYDITPLYPGTPDTGVSADVFEGISSTVLREQAIPLNLINPAAGIPTDSLSTTNPLAENAYQADASNPFPNPIADLALDSQGINAKYLGVHYFDAKSSPTFDLAGGADPAGLFFSGAKTGGVKAPTEADKGVLNTGAVDWLQLGDNGRGLSKNVAGVYRVVTAGGVAEACSVSGATNAGEAFSVPYTAQYWFYSA